jgi:hypothetical protein
MKKIKQRFFIRNHKSAQKENLSSLIGVAELRGTHGHSEPPVTTIASQPLNKLSYVLGNFVNKSKASIQALTEKVSFRVSTTLGRTQTIWSEPREFDSRVLVKKTWLTFSLPAFSLAALVAVIVPFSAKPNVANRYSIYSGIPLISSATNYQIYSKDSRAQKINEVFKQYNCPLEGLGEVFVYEADKNNIPWWVVPAIAFQESSCGKLTPEVKGVESYNAWGWAVYGEKVHMFDNWVRGIETVSEYLSERFYSKGVTDLCQIMKTYTPPSQGSWCKGVQFFGDSIVDFTSSAD